MSKVPGLTDQQFQEMKNLIREGDEAFKSQPEHSSDAKLIVLANYGDLAWGYLKTIAKAADAQVKIIDDAIAKAEGGAA